MLTVQEALETILTSGEPITATEVVPLTLAINRVLSGETISPINVPPENNSAMDGYAVSSFDIAEIPLTLDISQRIPAGKKPEKLKPRTSARIFTGGVLPPGSDAVVMQEDCEQTTDGLKVVVKHKVKAGENVRIAGQDVIQGSKLFEKGHLLRPQDLGLLASVGFPEIEVFRKPKVALFGTGDELIEPGNPLLSGQIYNSNKFMLAAMIKQLGCDLVMPHEKAVADTLEATVDALKSLAGKVDLILTTGGVSVGEEDYIKPALELLGEIQNWKIKLKPGKPLVFGSIKSSTLIGLPGNPVSSFVTFLLFVAPYLRRLQGLNKYTVDAKDYPLNFDLDRPRERPEFLRVQIRDGLVERFDNQSSGVLTSTVWADALAFIPEDLTFSRGDRVKVYFLNELQSQGIA